MDAGNMLKPMLARGELRMVGATTLDEYREHIEKDPALERRFQQVLVGEPSRRGHDRDPARAQGPLRGAPQGADRRRARWSPRRRCPTATSPPVPARTRRSTWSTRRRPGCAWRSTPGRSRSTSCSARSTGCRWRSSRWQKEADAGVARSGSSGCAPTWPTGRSSSNALNARWEREKAGLNRVGELKKRLDDLQGQVERAQRDGDFETASRLLYAEIPALPRSELAEADARPTPIAATAPMVKEEVGPDDVADVVAAWTGIPAGRLLEGETAKLLRMEEELGRAGDRPERGRAGGLRRGAPRPGRASPTPTGRPARSCSSGRPASARPSWPRRWPSSCSTTSGRWSAST